MKLKNYWRFLAVFLFLLVSLLILEQTKTLVRKDNWPVMLNASRRMEVAMAAVREEKLNRGYKISPIDDPNQTGMIGEPYTEITTTLGNLEAKRSTANPNTAAMVVDMLTQCGAEKGDTVAVNLSSSFPCLNLAVLCALDAMELKGIQLCRGFHLWRQSPGFHISGHGAFSCGAPISVKPQHLFFSGGPG